MALLRQTLAVVLISLVTSATLGEVGDGCDDETAGELADVCVLCPCCPATVNTGPALAIATPAPELVLRGAPSVPVELDVPAPPTPPPV